MTDVKLGDDKGLTNLERTFGFELDGRTSALYGFVPFVQALIYRVEKLEMETNQNREKMSQLENIIAGLRLQLGKMRAREQ